MTSSTYRTKRRGEPELEYTYTLEEAKLAGYTDKNNWKENPRAMLRARASSMLAELEYSDVTGGIASTEEAIDHAPVVQTGEWTTTPMPTDKVKQLRAGLESAASAVAVDAAYAAVVAAHKGKDITDAEKADLKAIGVARKATLTKPAPPAATPTPGTPHDPITGEVTTGATS